MIGAGGAGLRAAIEAAATGANVGLVCKSLLGKAHTVMAEGGVAAALGHVAEATPGRSTSGTRWSAASSSTTRGWPSSTPRRRPTGSASSRPGAPSSTGPATAGSSSARSAGTRHPRLAHVGDRTGLEMIRTLQDRAVAAGISVYMECTITHLLSWTDRVRGALGYWRTTGQPVVFAGQVGRAGDRRRSAGRSRSRRTRGSTRATARPWPISPAPSSSTWSSSSSTRPGWSGRRASAGCW